MTKIAAIIGGGVIGGGWAARFALNGWQVQVFDPDPQAERKVAEVLANARRSMPGLTDVALPAEGGLRFCTSIAEAVEGAVWIQESVPERLEVKHSTLSEIQAACDAQAVIGSSTSGFKPSELRAGSTRPDQIMVAHPFNPVYLLPLVELVPAEGQDGPLVDRAKELLTGLGMYPLHLRKEIDAHVADRLLEAVWRESLWLVKDGIATTEEIDDAIRYGFGIRWAQMGLFETYRVAGGEAGMKHFMSQFGPALKWPWTKLMDVPEFDETLVDLIAGQSDAQSGAYGIRDLERIRDNNLVAMMRALKQQDWGAGRLMKQHEAALRAGTVLEARASDIDDPSDRFMELIGCDAAYIASGGSFFTAETHIRHVDEVHAGAVIDIRTRVLLGAGKKMHLWHEMYEGDRLLATGEHFLLHVSLETRKPSDPSPEIAAALTRFAQAHAALPMPEGVGRFVGAPR